MSETDSVIISEEIYNKLLAYHIQYEEYNFTETHIIRKMFHNLVNLDNINPRNATNIIKDFYLFNSYRITQSEVDETLDQLNQTNNNMNINNSINLPPSLQTLFSRYPIINHRINNSFNLNPITINNNVQTVSLDDVEPIELNDSVSLEFQNSLNLSPTQITQPPYEQLSDYPYIPSINFTNRNPIISNIITNPLLTHGIRHTAPSRIIFSNQPRQIITQNYTDQILRSVHSIVQRRMQQAQNNMEDVPIVLKPEEFDKLSKQKYSDLPQNFRKDFKSCPISMQDYEDDTMLVKLPCNHYFSVDFAKTWLLENSHKCPVCRASAGESKPKID